MYRFPQMIYIIGLLSLQFFLTQSLFPQAPKIDNSDSLHIFIIAGQSNAINIHSNAKDLPAALIDTSVYFYYHCGMPPDRNIPFFSTSDNKWTKLSIQRQKPFLGSNEYFFGPEMTFISSLRNLYKNLAVIKCAYGGSNLAEDWKRGSIKGNMLYKIMLDQIGNACRLFDSVGFDYSFEGFLWIQGEADAANQSYAKAYLNNLNSFINGVRADLKSPQLPFVLSRLPVKQPYPYLSLVRNAQEQITNGIDYIKVIDTDRLELDKDSVHFISSGMIKLGSLLASGFRNLITSNSENISELNVGRYELRQNYPNPFNPVTYISFSIPESKFVRLKIYDILGREVSVLLNKQLEAGEHKIRFEDHFLPGGIYIYSLQAGQFRDSKKLLLLK